MFDEPHVIAICSPAGVAGRTTLALGLAGLLASRDRQNVLIADLCADSQATRRLLHGEDPPEADMSLAGLLTEWASAELPHGADLAGRQWPTTVDRVRFLASAPEVDSRLHHLGIGLERRAYTTSFVQWLKAGVGEPRTDVILLDCPSGNGPMTRHALRAADEIVLLVPADAWSVRAAQLWTSWLRRLFDAELDPMNVVVVATQAFSPDVTSLHAPTWTQLARPFTLCKRVIRRVELGGDPLTSPTWRQALDKLYRPIVGFE